MPSDAFFEDETEAWAEEIANISPLLQASYPTRNYAQQRMSNSRNIFDVSQPGEYRDMFGSPSRVLQEEPRPLPLHHVLAFRSTAPQLRIVVPTAVPSAPSSNSDASTPQLDSPETPASLASIAGVVDLTQNITTISTYAIAQGGLSDIYKGHWHQRGESGSDPVMVAIKVLRILTRKDQDGVRTRKRLNREVYVWHRLEHPNVVKLFGTSYHISGRPAMIMQWYDNGNATEYLSKKNPQADRVKLILDVARGMEYLHTHRPPIVHADLKGNNVLITDDGRAALCDFGLSQVIEDLAGPTGFTPSNPDVGPLRWQAPEFLEGDDEHPTPASDVWSFGCTAFELLTGQLPYAHCKRDGQVVKDMQNGIPPSGPPGQSPSPLLTFDPRVCTLLESCWSFYPSARPQMTRVRTQLEEICAPRP